jgi:hypothetical protein
MTWPGAQANGFCFSSSLILLLTNDFSRRYRTAATMVSFFSPLSYGVFQPSVTIDPLAFSWQLLNRTLVFYFHGVQFSSKTLHEALNYTAWARSVRRKWIRKNVWSVWTEFRIQPGPNSTSDLGRHFQTDLRSGITPCSSPFSFAHY